MFLAFLRLPAWTLLTKSGWGQIISEEQWAMVQPELRMPTTLAMQEKLPHLRDVFCKVLYY